jgi:hypothetical protein
MDFMHDVLADGTKIRLLTIVDTFSGESIALEVDYGFKSPQVAEVLRRAVGQRGAPQRIHCDNGPEFISLHLDQWAYWTQVKLAFSRPVTEGKSPYFTGFTIRRQNGSQPLRSDSGGQIRLRSSLGETRRASATRQRVRSVMFNSPLSIF